MSQESLSDQYNEYQFNLYSKSASFQGNQLILEGVPIYSLIYEVRSSRKIKNEPYWSDKILTEDIAYHWLTYFPIDLPRPNALINGFDSNGMRKLLTFSVKSPEIEEENNGYKLTFDTILDKFDGNMDIDDVISEWNRKGSLNNVSLLIDTIHLPGSAGEEAAKIAAKIKNTTNAVTHAADETLEGVNKLAQDVEEKAGKVLTDVEKVALKTEQTIKVWTKLLPKVANVIGEIIKLGKDVAVTVLQVLSQGDLAKTISQAQEALFNQQQKDKPDQNEKCQGSRDAAKKSLMQNRAPVSCADLYAKNMYDCCVDPKKPGCDCKDPGSTDETDKRPFCLDISKMTKEQCDKELA